jgi:hypothetical protein
MQASLFQRTGKVRHCGALLEIRPLHLFDQIDQIRILPIVAQDELENARTANLMLPFGT